MVANLVQRRFVATMYDVAPPAKNYGDGSAYDPDAIAAVGPMDELRRGRRGGGSEDRNGRVTANSYPTALFLAPDGERLGDGLWGIMPPERLLRGLRDVIAKWPQYFEPTTEERAVVARADAQPDDADAQLDAARLSWDLAEFEAVVSHAQRGLGKAPPPIRAELQYLKARALTCLGRDDEARTSLLALGEATVDETGADLALAVQVALARLELRAGKPEEAATRLRPFCTFATPMRDSGAVLYTTGLALWRQGGHDEAKVLWRQHRRELPFDRLARRSAASLGLDEAEAFRNQELFETKGWW
ncbi:MAG TPA: hypothetical protein VFT55_11430 [Planctomycetota bacterium]|nr:hypothetical protein [Planctomycetota bacterium]